MSSEQSQTETFSIAGPCWPSSRGRRHLYYIGSLTRKQLPRQSALAANRLECADADFFVIRDDDRDRAADLVYPLQRDVAAAPPDFREAVRFENCDQLASRYPAQATQC